MSARRAHPTDPRPTRRARTRGTGEARVGRAGRTGAGSARRDRVARRGTRRAPRLAPSRATSTTSGRALRCDAGTRRGERRRARTRSARVRVCAERRRACRKRLSDFFFSRSASDTCRSALRDEESECVSSLAEPRRASNRTRRVTPSIYRYAESSHAESSLRDASSQTIRSGPARTPPCAPRW